ncbi:UNVERIFIED_CONTAM: hypothetical protein RMT77_004706 [Armadillidium vulgare]
MISDVPSGFEAHKLINISLGKIAAGRSGRTGTSLHKSLLVASVLHKARYVYLEEAHHYHHTIFCPPQGQPEEFVPDPPRAPTPLPEVTVTPVVAPVMPQDSAENYQSEYDDNSDNDDDNNDDNNNEYPSSDDNISEECKSRLSGECDGESSDLETLCFSRKRRRVSDQETEAAISSILPKRLKSEIETDPSCNDCYYSTETAFKYETKILCSCGYELASCQCAHQPSTEDDEVRNMEVDHITSLVSIFSFNQQQQQQQQQQQSQKSASDLCSKQAHHQSEAVGPPVLALTA